MVCWVVGWLAGCVLLVGCLFGWHTQTYTHIHIAHPLPSRMVARFSRPSLWRAGLLSSLLLEGSPRVEPALAGPFSSVASWPLGVSSPYLGVARGRRRMDGALFRCRRLGWDLSPENPTDDDDFGAQGSTGLPRDLGTGGQYAGPPPQLPGAPGDLFCDLGLPFCRPKRASKINLCQKP